jgi:hypothetical protein
MAKGLLIYMKRFALFSRVKSATIMMTQMTMKTMTSLNVRYASRLSGARTPVNQHSLIS